MIFSMVFSALIIHCFLSVYEMTVDTIFLCYCEDTDKNDGDLLPYFMSTDLKEVMDKLATSSDQDSNDDKVDPEQK